MAQSVSISNASEAVVLALEKNLDLQNYIANQAKADIEYKQSKSYRKPTITGTFNGQKNLDLATTPLPAEVFGGTPGETIDTQFGQEYTHNVGISIYKDVFNREAALQKELASLNMDLQGLSKQLYEELLTEQVYLYYYTAIIAQRAIAIGKRDLESAKQVQELTRQKQQEGIIDAIAYNHATINYHSVKQSLNASIQMEQQSLAELKMLFGMQAGDTLTLAKMGDDYQLPELFSIDQLEANLQVQNATLQLRQADAYVKLSQSSLLPTVSLNTYIGRQQFRDDFGLSFSGDDWSRYSYMSLNLSVPIFSGFNSRRNIKSRKLDQQVALNEKVKTELHTSIADQQLIADYQLSLEDAELAFQMYRLYQENERLTFQKHEEGLISLDSYLNVFEDYIKAENAYLNSMTKAYTYYSQIIPRI